MTRPNAPSFTLHGVRHQTLDIDELSIRRNQLTTLTGVSGSGKSSLAFDTVYAYGYLQYMQSLSAFARRKMAKPPAPDVEWITGLTPTVAIEQKTVSRNPRSTVGSLTEIGDRIRLLMARAGIHSCPNCSAEVRPNGAGDHEAWIDCGGTDDLTLVAGGEVLVERGESSAAFTTAISRGLQQGLSMVLKRNGEAVRHVAPGWVCTTCGAVAEESSSNYFSPNSPQGMCPTCHGIGTVTQAEEATMVADPRLSVLAGALSFYGDRRKSKKTWWPLKDLPAFIESGGFSLTTPWNDIPRSMRDLILFGRTDQRPPPRIKSRLIPPGGLAANLQRLFAEADAAWRRDFYQTFMAVVECHDCLGTRLNQRALRVRLGGVNIAEINNLPVAELPEWLDRATKELDTPLLQEIGRELVPQLAERFQFLLDVGLHYLTLARSAPSLSAGEGQRVRLARQLGCGLAGVTYVLDEPSIGLHPNDVQRLIDTLRTLVDRDNTVLVVEHDRVVLEASDELIELGPGAGLRGGRVVARGPAASLRANPDSLTGAFLRGDRIVELTDRPRSRTESWIGVRGASLHNLKSVDVDFPLQRLTCVTGVSGSGKSSLVLGTLWPAMESALTTGNPRGPLTGLSGWGRIGRVLTVSQDMLTGSSRSTPATYLGIFDHIRKAFAARAADQGVDLTASDFSFNVKGGGRCDVCAGKGVLTVEMLFMADARVTCTSCNGLRYGPAALEVRIDGLSIADVLNTEASVVAELFSDHRAVAKPLQMLMEVGLGYVRLGQDTASLSGGESQRLKLSRELLRAGDDQTLYLIDEPTTGLHFADIQVLLGVLDRLVERGNTVVVIEHDVEFISSADWIVDLGPGGGRDGGYLRDAGTPDDIMARSLARIAPHLADYHRHKEGRLRVDP